MKKTLAMLLCAMMILGLVAAPVYASDASSASSETSAASEASAAEEVDKSDWVTATWSYASFLAADAPNQDGITMLQENIDKYMGEGYITIESYPNGTLLGMLDIAEGVENGVAELGFAQMSVSIGKYPVEQVAEIAGPYYASTKAGSATIKEYLETVQPEEFSKAIPLFTLGQVPLAICSTKPINSIEDLKGMQIRATGYAAEAVSRWGAVPVSMAIGEVYEALRNGLVDGCVSSVGAFGNSMFQEVADYCTMMPFIGYSCLVLLNRDTYESLPESQREAFDKACEDTWEGFYCKYLEELENDELSQKYIHDIGQIEGIKWLDDEALQPFADALEGLTDDYKTTLNDLGFDGDYLVDLYLEILDKYNEMYPPVPENYSKWY